MPSSTDSNDEAPIIKRLVDWNTEILHRLLKQILAHRQAIGKDQQIWDDDTEPKLPMPTEEGAAIIDEVADVIDLPGFCHKNPSDPDMIDLPPAARVQLRAFVAAIAKAYHGNPFHCLQFASAAMMHMSKLLSRMVVKELGNIVEEDEEMDEEEEDDCSTNSTDSPIQDIDSHLHNHTYGISSDPLTQFSMVLAAFVHVVDHTGISNGDLIKEDPETAALYKNRSIIEQRSVEKVWNKLMQEGFEDLRQCIYVDVDELKRFRQIMVNSVLSTNVEDVELQTMRNSRWEKVLGTESYSVTKQDINRRATIVLEHLMQASDVFYTMQPWVVYQKWCSRNFEEKLNAFKNGRVTEDPTTTWVQKELEFFDNYCIPLAMELKECDAFTVSSDEYLDCALRNRKTLAIKGKDMILTLIKQINDGKSTNSSTNILLSPIKQNTKVSLVSDEDTKIAKHNERLVKWNVEILKQSLRQVVAKRQALGLQTKNGVVPPIITSEVNILDEFSEFIEMPPFDPSVSPDKLNASAVELGPDVENQLLQFVTQVSVKFSKNDFLGVDRSSQMCMNTKKLLTRITSLLGNDTDAETIAADLHRSSFGISSDPLAQFALVFAGLINHVDHPGVPNGQLVMEGHDLAEKYNNRCISEQNTVAVALDMLMQPKFENLRACIFSDESEAKRFQQVVINCIMATNFADEDLVEMRKRRWEVAFVRGRHDKSIENENRRATILLELIMQASDVFHATQSWSLYHKWNERHFTQVYRAFKNGRLMQNPSVFWYKSELLYFDEQVIPVVQQMSQTQAFHTTGDQLLSFALSNRQQWAAKGFDHVASFMARYHGGEIEKTRKRRAFRRMSLSATVA